MHVWRVTTTHKRSITWEGPNNLEFICNSIKLRHKSAHFECFIISLISYSLNFKHGSGTTIRFLQTKRPYQGLLCLIRYDLTLVDLTSNSFFYIQTLNFIIPWRLCWGVYSFHLIVRQLVCLSVCLFVRSFDRTSLRLRLLLKFL